MNLDSFERLSFSDGRWTRDYYKAGKGPAVIVIHEIPGLHPGVVDFGRRVIESGFTVYMPSLFGTPGKPMTSGYVASTFAKACVAGEFTVFASGKTSPIVSWLRALGAKAYEECGGPGVGAVGMCFTGGYALGMMVDDHMLAPVLSQPASPLPTGSKSKSDVGLSSEDLEKIKARAANGACALGLRFTRDPAVPAERFDTLRKILGDGFTAVEIDSSPGNPHGIPKDAHSVLTEHFVDEPGHPTREAMGKVLTFFQERLTV